MQWLWSADELGERWSLLPEDLALLAGQVDAGKLGFAVQLAFWRQHGRFPDEEVTSPRRVVRAKCYTSGNCEALGLGGPDPTLAFDGCGRCSQG